MPDRNLRVPITRPIGTLYEPPVAPATMEMRRRQRNPVSPTFFLQDVHRPPGFINGAAGASPAGEDSVAGWGPSRLTDGGAQRYRLCFIKATKARPQTNPTSMEP